MVKFIDIDPADIDTSRHSRRGRVSYPIIKGFLERNVKVSKLDLTGLDKNPQYLRSVLQTYITNHNMPIKLFSAGGALHLMRLDIDNDGNPIEDWEEKNPRTTEGAAGLQRFLEPKAITGEEVERRFQEEVGKSTK